MCVCVYVRVCVLGCEKFGSVQNLLIVLLNGKKVEAIEDEICYLVGGVFTFLLFGPC